MLSQGRKPRPKDQLNPQCFEEGPLEVYLYPNLATEVRPQKVMEDGEIK